jgi:aminotransferase in exopolysaccharide biosynthesis
MSKKIPLSIPSLQGNEWKYIKECLDTEWVSSAGKYVDLFEEKIADYTGIKYAVSCVNGTSALQMALRLAGVDPGDEVIVPTLTFIAPINAVAYNSASPIFMDADDYYNIDSTKTIEFINKETVFKDGFTFNKRTNRKIKAIIPVHVFGNAILLDELIPLCEERKICVVEDASESMGTRYSKHRFSGKHTGTIGRIGCLSFNGNKIITSGGGGMILTDDSQLADKARYLTTQAKDDPVRYIHHEIGYNFRLTNIQAALGVAQLEQLPGFLEYKKKIHQQYVNGLDNTLGVEIAKVPNYADNNHWMIAIQINKEIKGSDLVSIMTYLAEKGIETRPIWHPNHLQKPYKNCQTYKIEKVFELAEKTLNIPCSVDLREEQIDTIVKCLE